MFSLKHRSPRQIKATLRWSYQRASWRQRALPDVIIIGAQKSGTTSLFNYLSQHPELQQSTVKEVHYFDGGLDPAVDNYAKGEPWYRAHFPLKRDLTGDAKAFEASPLYMFSPWVPERIASLLPHAKLIAILRNPTERAVSHYFHELRKGREKAAIHEALATEEDRLASSWRNRDFKSHNYLHCSYKSRGIYHEQLKRFLAFFPQSQLLVLSSERLFQSPAATLRRVFDFVGVDPSILPSDLRASNVAGNKRPLGKAVYEELDEFFRPHNQSLYQLVGEDFGW